jgi:hypothetical protein
VYSLSETNQIVVLYANGLKHVFRLFENITDVRLQRSVI